MIKVILVSTVVILFLTEEKSKFVFSGRENNGLKQWHQEGGGISGPLGDANSSDALALNNPCTLHLSNEEVNMVFQCPCFC